jgi:hypothetical protein
MTQVAQADVRVDDPPRLPKLLQRHAQVAVVVVLPPAFAGLP